MAVAKTKDLGKDSWPGCRRISTGPTGVSSVCSAAGSVAVHADFCLGTAGRASPGVIGEGRLVGCIG
jgi:hypothetical protein